MLLLSLYFLLLVLQKRLIHKALYFFFKILLLIFLAFRIVKENENCWSVPLFLLLFYFCVYKALNFSLQVILSFSLSFFLLKNKKVRIGYSKANPSPNKTCAYKKSRIKSYRHHYNPRLH